MLKSYDLRLIGVLSRNDNMKKSFILYLEKKEKERERQRADVRENNVEYIKATVISPEDIHTKISRDWQPREKQVGGKF